MAWLATTTLSATLQARLQAAVPWDRVLGEAELVCVLAASAVMLNVQQRQQVWDALAIAAYHAQSEVPIVRLLLSDDAAVFHGITDAHALCWVHGRT